MRHVRGFAILVFVVVVGLPLSGQIPPYGGAAEYRADLAARRARVLDALGPASLLVAWSAPVRVYSADVDYEYRQDSNLLYLTGIEQEETILLLIPGARVHKEILFTREADPRREHWNGHTLTAAEASAQSGISTVLPLSAFQAFVESALSGAGTHAVTGEMAAEFAALAAAVKGGTARIGILERVGGAGGRGAAANQPPAAGSRAQWALELQQKVPGVTPFSATQILTTLRQVKTPYEQKVLRRSVEISAEAHIEGMRAARPGRWEYEVEAAIEYWYMKNGAMTWGYTSIVCSVPNATVVHYGNSTRQMKDGYLQLEDYALLAGAIRGFLMLAAGMCGTLRVNWSGEQRREGG